MVLFKILPFYLFIATTFGWSHVSKAQFRSTVHKNDMVLVTFVAPWTVASKALELEWSSAAAQAGIPLVSVDCTVEADLCEDNDVISYPAIRLFRGDVVSRYRGARKASAIVSFINRSKLPATSFLGQGNVTAFKSIDEAVFIAYMKPQDADLRSTFATLAERNHDRFVFGIVSDPSIATADDMPFPSIVCYKTREGELLPFSGQPRLDTLEEWAEKAATPLVGEMTSKNEMNYLKTGKSLVYVFALTESERSTFRAALSPVAKKYKEYLSFATIDALEYGHMAQALGLEAGVFPALALKNPSFGQVFPYAQRRPITAETVESFILDIAQSRAEPVAGTMHDEL